MARAWHSITEKQFNELLRLSRMYRREAHRCIEAQAYLAGCVVAGSALETALTAIVHLYANKVEHAGFAAQRNGSAKRLLDWNLSDLLNASSGMGWLPRALEKGADWSDRRAKVGDYADVLRQIRNLAHPARYLQDQSPSRITRKHAEFSLEVLDAAVSHLAAVVNSSLFTQLKRRELVARKREH
ncbi:MAG: hypothetical protein J0H27_16010 [Xanthomonadales bacterium]|nr:hypothetical protein [Xanthomonadales bacterium]